MFGKKRNQVPTIIGSGAEFDGDLTVRGGLRVDGVIRGNVQAKDGIAIGPEGTILGDIDADQLTISGSVEGQVRVTGELHVSSTGKIRGEVFYDTLQVDRGAVLSGQTTHQSREEEIPIEELSSIEEDAIPALPEGPVPGEA